MRLYIAEKPSLARAIAAALPGRPKRRQGWLECDDGVCVSWCVGHLLSPAEPGEYHPEWQRWRLQTLPIIPESWKASPRESVRDQLAILQSLIAKADSLVHAGDPDREGQLLVDEVLRYCQVRIPVDRVLINDLTPDAVQRALADTRDNRQFRRLSHSALARQRADWLYGINLTRAYTLRYQQQGEQGVYSVGRVQTPVLGLVVQRDRTIAHFTPRPFYSLTVQARPDTSDNSHFIARWQAGERHETSLDEEGRLLDRSIAETIAGEVQGQTGTITNARFREREEAPPLPLSLSVLQIEAGRLFGLSARDTLDTAQSLYEKHQLITYPRSDCRYLPEGHFMERLRVTDAITAVAPELSSDTESMDTSRRSRAWDDQQVDAHHAIIPTTRQRPAGPLSRREQQVYQLVARYYLMQFFPPATHREGRLDLAVEGHDFRATETGVVAPGWKQLEPRSRESESPGSRRPPLPRLETGDAVQITDTGIRDRETTPPRHFTDATLLSAMTHIARFVEDAEQRRTLRETDGLGTEATRAAIIETLFQRDYLYRDGRAIRATDKGMNLIDALPDTMAKPDMTAQWEATLEQIRQGNGDPRQFLGELETHIRALIAPLQQGGGPAPTADPGSGIHCPRCRAPMCERESRYGRFWACTRYPDCRGTRPIEASDVAATDGTDQAPVPCPACYSPLVRRQGKKGWFWGCSQFPGCRQTVEDRDGKPATSALPSGNT
ncbi:DNA topoisomerase-3 [Tamilnaduibacter salinus]|uniref:DNA topoisomerase n=1 Tax=Tamilnaduibacter salinus TaxID=1484056 RepID=A0A2U1CT89_9GAMM|nr:DNA topoisomerase III [Tamilnaduibacter salinus]PVY69804.1 DNA topoisomerase-3 [Tamilnaduibacter salinus]